MIKWQKYLLLLGILVLASADEASAHQTKIDSLLLLLKTAKEDTNKVNVLNELSWQYQIISSYDTSLLFARQSEALSKKLKFNSGLARSYMNFSSTLEQRGYYPDAVKKYLEALKIYETMNNPLGQAKSLANIGGIYFIQNNYDEAIKFFIPALDFFIKANNNKWISYCYSQLGTIYSAKKDFDQALKYHRLSIRIKEEIKDRRGLSGTYINIGAMHADMKQYDSAIYYLDKGFEIKKEIDDKKGMTICYVNYGMTYTVWKDFRNANNYFLKARSLAYEIRALRSLSDSYLGLSTTDSALGNYKSAFENYKQHIIYRDSLKNEENTRKIVQSQMQYEFDKQQASDSIKNVEQAKREALRHDQEIKQQRIYTNGGLIGFLLMLVVAGVSFRAFKNKQKANVIISEQKDLVEMKQKEIIDSINYAKRIQGSLLPTEKYIEKNLKRLNK